MVCALERPTLPAPATGSNARTCPTQLHDDSRAASTSIPTMFFALCVIALPNVRVLMEPREKADSYPTTARKSNPRHLETCAVAVPTTGGTRAEAQTPFETSRPGTLDEGGELSRPAIGDQDFWPTCTENFGTTTLVAALTKLGVYPPIRIALQAATRLYPPTYSRTLYTPATPWPTHMHNVHAPGTASPPRGF